MLLAVDIGNSNIKFGIFDGENLHSRFSIPTNKAAVPDNLDRMADERFAHPLTDAVVCSVVPEVNGPLAEFLHKRIGLKPVLVSNDWDFGMKILYEPLANAGTDRIVNCFSAVSTYGSPCVVCSFGTALTI